MRRKLGNSWTLKAFERRRKRNWRDEVMIGWVLKWKKRGKLVKVVGISRGVNWRFSQWWFLGDKRQLGVIVGPTFYHLALGRKALEKGEEWSWAAEIKKTSSKYLNVAVKPLRYWGDCCWYGPWLAGRLKKISLKRSLEIYICTPCKPSFPPLSHSFSRTIRIYFFSLIF